MVHAKTKSGCLDVIRDISKRINCKDYRILYSSEEYKKSRLNTLNKKMKISNIKSKQYFSQAKKFIPGGVNSPVRAFKAVGWILYLSRKPRRLYLRCGWKQIHRLCAFLGSDDLRHADERVLKPVTAVLKKGSSFGLLPKGKQSWRA